MHTFQQLQGAGFVQTFQRSSAGIIRGPVQVQPTLSYLQLPTREAVYSVEVYSERTYLCTKLLYKKNITPFLSHNDQTVARAYPEAWQEKYFLLEDPYATLLADMVSPTCTVLTSG